MDKQYRKMTDFLAGLGTAEVSHSTKTYLGHLVGVHRDLEAWGCDQDVCRAGMFHSIYGTEPFHWFRLPLDRRDEVRDLIGIRAERIAYLNCAMTRETFDRTIQQDQGPYAMIDRFTGEEVVFSPADFRDLCTVHLCDWLETVERNGGWDDRRIAFRRLADILSGVAKDSYERVFARESHPPVSTAATP